MLWKTITPKNASSDYNRCPELFFMYCQKTVSRLFSFSRIILIFSLIGGLSFSLLAQNDTTEIHKIRLRLKWFHKFQFAGYYAAKEKGFYLDENLDVRITERDPREETVDSLMNGTSEYAISDTNIILDYQKGGRIKILAAILQHSPLILISLRKSGITTPHDLLGKKVMYGQDDKASIIAMMLEEGVSPLSFSYVRHSYNIQDLINGNIDAMTAYITNEPYEFKKKGIPINIINPLNYGIDIYGDLLITTEEEILKNPENTKKFIRASLKGWDYALRHRDEIIQLIIDKYNPGLDKIHLEYEAEEIKRFIIPDLIELGHINPKRFERISEI